MNRLRKRLDLRRSRKRSRRTWWRPGRRSGASQDRAPADDPTFAEAPDDPPAGEEAWVVEDDLEVPDQTEPSDEEANVTETQARRRCLSSRRRTQSRSVP